MLGGSIGALGVFALQIVRDHLRSRRELRGLSRLLHAEFVSNHNTLGDFHYSPERAITDAISGISTETWESVRMRVAEMMPAYDLWVVINYYLYLEQIRYLHATQDQYADPERLAAVFVNSVVAYEPRATDAVLLYANLRPLVGSRHEREFTPEPYQELSGTELPGQQADQ